jgi:hypothetical protein
MSWYNPLSWGKGSNAAKINNTEIAKDESRELDSKLQITKSSLIWCERITNDKYPQLAEVSKDIGFSIGDSNIVEFMASLDSTLLDIKKELHHMEQLLLENTPNSISEASESKTLIENQLKKQQEYVSLIKLHVLPNVTRLELVMGKSAASIFAGYLQSVYAEQKYLAKLSAHLDMLVKK